MNFAVYCDTEVTWTELFSTFDTEITATEKISSLILKWLVVHLSPKTTWFSGKLLSFDRQFFGPQVQTATKIFTWGGIWMCLASMLVRCVYILVNWYWTGYWNYTQNQCELSFCPQFLFLDTETEILSVSLVSTWTGKFSSSIQYQVTKRGVLDQKADVQGWPNCSGRNIRPRQGRPLLVAAYMF